VNRTSHQHPTGSVKEGQATGFCFLTHDSHRLRNSLWLGALISTQGVHLGGFRAALARWGWLNAKQFQQF
jgi:hypothetical protein